MRILDFFKDCYMFILKAILKGTCAIVCDDCITMAPTIAIAFLMRHNGDKYLFCKNSMQTLCPDIKIPPCFEQQLEI